MGKKEYKTDNQITTELLNENKVKEIKFRLMFIYEKTRYSIDKGNYYGTLVDIDLVGETLLELVKENSNDFTKDIAEKALKNNWNLSEKQAWCVAYQIHNNIEVYRAAMKEYSQYCDELLAKEQLKEQLAENSNTNVINS